MIKKVFAVTPKYKEITKGRTHYVNDKGETFALTRSYNSLFIKMINIDASYDITVDNLIAGENIRGFLGYWYPGSVCEILMTDFCGIDFSYDMPDDVRKKLTSDPEYDLDDDGWIAEDIYYDFDSGSDYADEVLVYTPFVVTLLKSVHIDNTGDEVIFTETMVDVPPLPIERPTLSFSMEEGNWEESSWDDMKWE